MNRVKKRYFKCGVLVEWIVGTPSISVERQQLLLTVYCEQEPNRRCHPCTQFLPDEALRRIIRSHCRKPWAAPLAIDNARLTFDDGPEKSAPIETVELESGETAAIEVHGAGFIRSRTC